MPGFFIASTGTDIGKTLLTAALCWQLREDGHKVQCLKPIMTGVDGLNWKKSDAAVLMASMENSIDAMALKQVSPWRFVDPISPHLAARKAGTELDLEEIASFCDRAMKPDTITLVEGAGGIMTPINETKTMLDLIQGLDIPVILVCGSYVGAISHTLTALAILNAQQVAVQAVVISESKGSATSAGETADTLRQFGGTNLPIYIVPRLSENTELWKDLPPLTEMLGL